MKRLLHAFAMCQSMFCALPCPWNIWDEDAKDHMLLFLPFVGLEIGLIWTVLSLITTYLALPAFVRGIILCAYPFLITGFIHLDGFMDVSDAIGSCRSLERRREILKDSHVGSFAVIGLGLILLMQFALLSSANGNPFILTLIPVVSRCGSVLAVSCLKPMNSSQYATRIRSSAQVGIVIVILCLAMLCGFLFCGKYGLALLGGFVGYLLPLRRGYRSLEGMNGDISGYALTISELCAVAVYALI